MFQIVDCIFSFLNLSADPVTFVKGALHQFLERTKEEFFSKVRNIMKEAANFCCGRMKDPYKPEGSMFIMVKLNMSLLEGINNDIDFTLKLAKEESVIAFRVLLPQLLANLFSYLFWTGTMVGMKNWVGLT
ncbi:hypothetical protein RJ641_015531 [Dillenia turbinata]|uniref:Uncharacterized protein n=1 Tax=Dillenia turbinata TaxID=194707 RepID=A0AAN8UZ67_9MAGN